MRMLWNRVLVSAVAVGTMALEAALPAAAARCSMPGDGRKVLTSMAAGVAAVDPVVEEPLRTLLPDEQPCPSGLPARCGQAGSLPLPLVAASLLALCLKLPRHGG